MAVIKLTSISITYMAFDYIYGWIIFRTYIKYKKK